MVDEPTPTNTGTLMTQTADPGQATPPTPTPPADPGDGGGGEPAASWLDSLPEDVRSGLPEDLLGNEKIAGYESLEAFLKGHVEALDAQPAPIAPETPDGYDLAPPEGLEFDPELTTAFKAKLHELGLSQDQAKELSAWYFENMMPSPEQAQALTEQAIAERNARALEETQKTLRQEWQADYDANIAQVQKVTKLVENLTESDEFAYALWESGVGSDPRIVRGFLAISAAISEDVLEGVTLGPAPPAPEPAKFGDESRLTYPSMERNQ